jgi:DNA recombination protein RmuC
MEILLLVIGLGAGLALGYFIASFKNTAKSQVELQNLQQQLQKLYNENSAVQAKLQQKELQELKIEKELKEAQQNVLQLSSLQSQLETTNLNLRERLAEQKLEMEKQHEKMVKEFENISSKVLRQNSDDFSKTSKERLELLLKPFQEKVKELETQVKTSYEQSIKESSSLREMVNGLAELNKQIGSEAQNLTKALKGEKKLQGNWGEGLLEIILEKSGLQENLHFVREESIRNSEGQLLRPDVIVNLPDQKHLVIDSKVSLNAYAESFSAEDELVAESKIKEHVKAIKEHINTLASKNYQKLHGINSPDFVLMYIPIEPAFTFAIQTDPQLFVYALDRNVVMVTNSTLLATLKTVAGIWKQEDQKKNVQQIAEMGGKLYDKFVGFVEDMEKIGKALTNASSAHEDAFKKLSTGRGNLINQAEKLKKMGSTSAKSLDDKLLGNADDE